MLTRGVTSIAVGIRGEWVRGGPSLLVKRFDVGTRYGSVDHAPGANARSKSRVQYVVGVDGKSQLFSHNGKTAA